MKRKQFSRHLKQATERIIDFTRPYVIDELHNNYLYLILPNSSCDGNANSDYEKVYPEDTLPEGEYRDPATTQDVMDFLWRDGRIPQWINITVHHSDANHTYLALECCGRFVFKPDYHQGEGYPPFHALGPTFQREWLKTYSRDWSFEECIRAFGKIKLPKPEQEESNAAKATPRSRNTIFDTIMTRCKTYVPSLHAALREKFRK